LTARIVTKNNDDLPARTGAFAISKRQGKIRADFSSNLAAGATGAPIATDPDYYPAPGSFRTELNKARQALDDFRLGVRQMINDVRVGKPLVIEPMEQPLKAMVESVIRHPDPMVWMTRLVIPQSFVGGHLMRTSILSVVLGRGMGLPERQLERLAWGGLLCQIGKARLPRQLLEKPGPLKSDELERIREFVPIGVELAQPVKGLEAEVLEIIRTHHERYDGSGYPQGLKGDQIPLLARLVGVVDWYDTMLSITP